VLERGGEHGVTDRDVSGDDDAGAGWQGAVAGVPVEGSADLFGGGDDEFAMVADGDRRRGSDGGEFGFDVAAAAADSVAGEDTLRGDQGVGVGVGRAVLAAVGVIPLPFVGDVVGNDSADDGDAGGVEGVVQRVENGCGVPVVRLVAHREQNRGVVVGRPQVARGGEPRCLFGGDRDVEPKVADTYRELFAGFPDFSFPDLEHGSLNHHGELVIAESRLQGTHLGTFRGLPPTGRRIDVPVVGIFEFDGHDLLCERAYFDRLTLFIQLGVARDPNIRAGKLTTLLNHPVTLARAALRSRRVVSR
jgi:predicted ester cyclase